VGKKKLTNPSIKNGIYPLSELRKAQLHAIKNFQTLHERETKKQNNFMVNTKNFTSKNQKIANDFEDAEKERRIDFEHRLMKVKEVIKNRRQNSMGSGNGLNHRRPKSRSPNRKKTPSRAIDIESLSSTPILHDNEAMNFYRTLSSITPVRPLT
jgi:hypothetical protein